MVKHPPKTIKFGSSIPELRETINKYGCALGNDKEGAPYVVVGQFYAATGPVGGILAAAQNEFYANLIRKEIDKNGSATVYRSEFHENPNFSIAAFKAKIREKIEAQKRANDEAELAETVSVAKKPFKLEVVK